MVRLLLAPLPPAPSPAPTALPSRLASRGSRTGLPDGIAVFDAVQGAAIAGRGCGLMVEWLEGMVDLYDVVMMVVVSPGGAEQHHADDGSARRRETATRLRHLTLLC